MKTLGRNEIMEIVTQIKNGTVARVTYKSEVPLKAAYRKQGYKVIKVTETTGRFGVDYNNISTVITRKAEAAAEGKQPVQRANNYVWLIDNKVKHNTVTDKDYLVLTSFNGGHNTRSKFIVLYMGAENVYLPEEFVANEAMKDLVIKSYWTPSSSNEVKTIMFENIIRINKTGEIVSF